MNRIALVVMAGMLVPGLGHAQASANAQAGASAQSQTGVGAQSSMSGVQASGSDSTSAQTNASVGAKAPAGSANNAIALSDGATMNAALKGSLDAKKSKVGDRVEAETTRDVKENGKVVLRKGTRLVGHVTEVQAREKSQAKSQIGVAFDRAELRNGQQVPLNASIQALAAAQSAARASAADDDAFAGVGAGASAAGAGASRGGGLVGGTLQSTSSTVSSVGSGVGSTASGVAGGTVNAAAHSTDAVGGLNAAGALTSNSRGVFGLEGTSLDAAASSATQGSLIVSSTKNVHLDSGTQMVLRVAGQAR
jgi:hypothetical protein